MAAFRDFAMKGGSVYGIGECTPWPKGQDGPVTKFQFVYENTLTAVSESDHQSRVGQIIQHF